jgi:hypothetical protein
MHKKVTLYLIFQFVYISLRNFKYKKNYMICHAVFLGKHGVALRGRK